MKCPSGIVKTAINTTRAHDVITWMKKPALIGGLVGGASGAGIGALTGKKNKGKRC